MQIGMAASIPNTPEQKAAMLTLAARLADAAQAVEAVDAAFNRPNYSPAIMVEARDFKTMLVTLAQQLTGVVNRA